jgi:hypothetical protein
MSIGRLDCSSGCAWIDRTSLTFLVRAASSDLCSAGLVVDGPMTSLWVGGQLPTAPR